MSPRQLILSALLLAGLAGCGHRLGERQFAGPIEPAITSRDAFAVKDDHTIVFIQQRLEVSVRPLTTQMLNRVFSSESTAAEGFHEPNPYGFRTNPYTFGDWLPPGEGEAPERFTVFLLKVKNYQYPKVLLEPEGIRIEAANGRRYQALGFPTLVEYHRPYAIAFAGNTYLPFQERRALLERTLYPESEIVFSGQELEGYVVFEPLHRDVERFTLHVKDMVLRFDYREEPVESVDIAYEFQRELYAALGPRARQH